MRTLPFTIVLVLWSGLTLAADSARVVTRENAVRKDCRFFSPVTAKVRYNDLLIITSSSGDWRRVTYRGVAGCIHKSALAMGSVSLTGGGGGRVGGASSAEVSLAAKGFNPQVEAAYKSSHPTANYAAVDAIEAYRVPDEALQAFMMKGGLVTP